MVNSESNGTTTYIIPDTTLPMSGQETGIAFSSKESEYFWHISFVLLFICHKDRNYF